MISIGGRIFGNFFDTIFSHLCVVIHAEIGNIDGYGTFRHFK